MAYEPAHHADAEREEAHVHEQPVDQVDRAVAPRAAQDGKDPARVGEECRGLAEQQWAGHQLRHAEAEAEPPRVRGGDVVEDVRRRALPLLQVREQREGVLEDVAQEALARELGRRRRLVQVCRREELGVAAADPAKVRHDESMNRTRDRGAPVSSVCHAEACRRCRLPELVDEREQQEELEDGHGVRAQRVELDEEWIHDAR